MSAHILKIHLLLPFTGCKNCKKSANSYNSISNYSSIQNCPINGTRHTKNMNWLLQSTQSSSYWYYYYY